MAQITTDSSVDTMCINCGKAVPRQQMYCNACKDGKGEGVADMKRDAMFGGGESSMKSVFDTPVGQSRRIP